MHDPALETIVETPTDRIAIADPAELELRADPQYAECLARLDALWSRPPLLSPPAALQSLGRFEIRRELGRGRFGVVFLAWDPQLQRQVALKVPQFDATFDPGLRDRFKEEALSAGKLQHPGIVPVFEVGQHAGIDYLAMAFIEGRTLADRLQLGPLSPADAARLTIGLARAIQHAHDRDVIHRDLKPSNVLLDKQDQPHVADFGLARRLSESAIRATVSGKILGTPAYMPPEQAAGKSDVGPACDIYSLGVILYESITGRPPFQAATFVEAVEFILHRDPLPPSKLNPKLPKELDAITFKCLEKKPAARYASAADLADDLQRYLEGQPIRARTQGYWQHAWRWAKRHPSQVMLIGALLVASGLLLATATAYDRWQRADERAAQQRQIAEKEKQAAAAERRAADAQRYFATVNRARNLIARRAPGWSQQALEEIQAAAKLRPADSDAQELRTLAAECLTGFDLLAGEQIAAGMLVGRITFSPDGQLLAVGELKGSATCRVVVYDVATQKPRHTFTILNLGSTFARLLDGETKKFQEGAREFAFSSDSRYLAVGMRFGSVYIYDLQEPDKPPRQLTVKGERELEKITFASDGRALFALTQDGEFLHWPDWQVTAQPETPRAEKVRSFAAASHGPGLFLQRNPGGFQALDQRLQVRQHFSPFAQLPQSYLSDLVTDGEGGLLAGKAESGLHVYETAGGFLLRRLKDDTVADEGLVTQLLMSADGNLLAAFHRSGIVRLFDIARGQQVLRLEIGRHESQDVALDPQRRWLVVANDDRLQFWKTNDYAIRTPVRSPADQVEDARFSPNGLHLAMAVKRGDILGPERFAVQLAPANYERAANGALAGFEYSPVLTGSSQLDWTADSDHLIVSNKTGAVMLDAVPLVGQQEAPKHLSLFGETTSVDFEVMPPQRDETAETPESFSHQRIPHSRYAQQTVTKITPAGRDFRLKCRVPPTKRSKQQFATLTLMLRADIDHAPELPLLIHPIVKGRKFPPSRAPHWIEGTQPQQWSFELHPDIADLEEFELQVSAPPSLRSLEIESIDYVAQPIISTSGGRRTIPHVDFLSIPPQGAQIWGAVDEQVCSWSQLTGARLTTWQNPQHALSQAGNIRCVQAGASGTLVGTRDGGLFWLDPRTGNTQAVWKGPGKEVVTAAICDEAAVALVGAENGIVRAVEISSGKTRFDLSADESAIVALAATPNARLLVTASTNRSLKVWKRGKSNSDEAYKLLCQLPDTPAVVRALSLSSDGKYLVVLQNTGVAVHWRLAALDDEFQRLGIQ